MGEVLSMHIRTIDFHLRATLSVILVRQFKTPFVLPRQNVEMNANPNQPRMEPNEWILAIAVVP